MAKRLIDIDDDVLEQARQVVGTTTLKDTVNQALRDSVRVARPGNITSADIAAFVAASEDLRNPEIMAKAWE